MFVTKIIKLFRHHLRYHQAKVLKMKKYSEQDHQDIKTAVDTLVFLSDSRNSKPMTFYTDGGYGPDTHVRSVRTINSWAEARSGWHYGVIKNGEPLLSQFTGCFGGLGDNPPVTQGSTFIFALRRRTDLCDKSFKKAMKWLVNDSPWSKIIVTKDVDFIYRYGIVVDARYSANYVGGALLAFKNIIMMREAKANLWFGLWDRGVNPSIAFAFLMANDGNIMNYGFRDMTSFIPWYQFTRKHMKAFAEGRVINNLGTYQSLGKYRYIPPFEGGNTVRCTFCHPDDSHIAEKFNKMLFNRVAKKNKVPLYIDSWGENVPVASLKVVDYMDDVAEFFIEKFPTLHKDVKNAS